MAKGVGLDAGEYEVKVVELEGSYRRPKLAKVSIDRASQLTGSAADQEHATREAQSLRHAVRDAHASTDNVCLGFPCREAVLRVLNVPFTGDDKIRKVIKFEAEGEIHGYNVDDMVVDFYTIGAAHGETRVLVAAVPKPPLRTTLQALEKARIEPETVDLDTMALFRVAQWAGAFDEGSAGKQDQPDPEDQEASAIESQQAAGAAGGARLVLDVGARSVRILVVKDGHLIDMRALRNGADSMAEEIAAAKEISLDEARAALLHCLAAADGEELAGDYIVVIDGERAAGEAGGAGEAREAGGGEASRDLPATGTVVSQDTVEAAKVRFISRLRGELLRFLTSVRDLGKIDAVYCTGAASVLVGVQELLQDVFGCTPQPLTFMDKLQHNLGDDEVCELEPRIAVALGLALGPMGGVRGFNFRQEDLIFTRRFDRIKLPLAVACMLILSFLVFFAIKTRNELKTMEMVYGRTFHPKQSAAKGKARATGRGGERSSKALPQFHGYLGHLVNRLSWPQMNLKPNEYRAMLDKLATTDVFRRIPVFRAELNSYLRSLQKDFQYVPELALESGVAVLQELAFVLDGAKDDLGRYLVGEIDLALPAGKKSRHLNFLIVLRGDFRTRIGALKKAFERAFDDELSPFKRFDNEAKESPFGEGDQAGAYYNMYIELKDEKIPVRHRG